MFEYNFAKLVARERKDELSTFLKTKHMLNESEGDAPRATKSKRLVLRLATVLIVITFLALCLIG